ncbi:MAG: peptidoglycan editing factor PgeF [Pseudomonadales bacterium]
MSELICLTPDWPAPANIRAAITTRAGGVSCAPYDGLNVASHVGDDLAAVAANRELLARHLSLPEQPVWLTQVHGVEVLRRDGEHISDILKPYDACYSNQPNTVCAVLTADCLPVLFCSRDGTEVAAAHAGWRGLLAGILEATVQQFSCTAADIVAWLGPAIGPQSFEVGDEVRLAFLQSWQQHDAQKIQKCFVAHRNQHWLCDIYALARIQLQAWGVGVVCGGGEDTYHDAARFYSYRREGGTGRMASLIWQVN